MNDRDIYDLDRVIRAVQESLTPDLLYKRWKNHPNPLAGHCYHASEAVYYLGAGAFGFKPYNVPWMGTSHWFLKVPNESDQLTSKDLRIDPTVGQFVIMPDYVGEKRHGWKSVDPSWCAQKIIDRVLNA